MLDVLSLAGLWSLPDAGATRIPGRLEFDPGRGVTLTLDGAFSPHAILDQRIIPVIHGRTTTGEYVTLLEAYYSTVTHHMSSGDFVSVVHASKVLVGAHFSSESDFQCPRAVMRFTHLSDWLGSSTLAVDITNLSTLNVQTRRIEPLPFTIDKNRKAQFEFSTHVEGAMNPPLEIILKHDAAVAVEFSEAASLSVVLETVWQLQNFLSLGIGKPSTPTSILCSCYASDPQGDGHTRLCTVDVRHPLPTRARSEKRANAMGMLFTYRAIAGKFEAIIQKWFESALVECPLLHSLFFGVVQNPPTTVQYRFLDLAKALECYHRDRFNNAELPPDEHEQRIKSILDVTPAQHVEWLRKKLTFSNEPPLRTKLDVVVAANPESCLAAEAHLEEGKTYAAIVPKIAKFRHDLTHGKTKTSIPQLIAVNKLCGPLQMLVTICLLREMGLSDAEAAKLVGNPTLGES